MLEAMHRKIGLFASAVFIAAAVLFSTVAPASALTSPVVQRSVGAPQLQHESVTLVSSPARDTSSAADLLAKTKKKKKKGIGGIIGTIIVVIVLLIIGALVVRWLLRRRRSGTS